MSLGVDAAAVRNCPEISPLPSGAGRFCVCTVNDGPATAASGDVRAVSTALVKESRVTSSGHLYSGYLGSVVRQYPVPKVLHSILSVGCVYSAPP